MIDDSHINTIRTLCKRFIGESGGLPILKNLPCRYDSFKRVKVRHGKNTCAINEHIDTAFSQSKLLQRAVLVNGPSSFSPILDEHVRDFNIFYIFVPDSYKFIYNPAVQQSNFDEMSIINENLINDVLTYGYTDINIHNGIEIGAEIILYNIPNYFCVKADTVDYDELLEAVS